MSAEEFDDLFTDGPVHAPSLAMLCPKCGNECWRDEVDVEVGILYGPWGCPCGWSSDPMYDTSAGPKFSENGHRLDQWGGLTPS